MAKKYTKGQLCGLIMGLTFSLVATIFFYKYFTMSTTLHMVEETLSDPAMPFLQSLSYSTTSERCGPNWVTVYDVLSAAAAAKSESVTINCDGSAAVVKLKKEVSDQLFNLAKISNLCFDYKMADADGKEMSIMAGLSSANPAHPDCQSALADQGKGIKSAKVASYLFPLPPANGLIARQVLTKFEPGDTVQPTAAPTPATTAST